MLKRNACFFLVAAIWLVLDRVTKIAAVNALAVPGTSVPVIDGVFSFTLVYNRGAAWGIFSDSTAALGVLSVVICIAILLLVFKSGIITTVPQAMVLGLIFGGGLGNGIDRLVMGRVTDFIQATFIDFPVFNVADIGVTCGVIIFVIMLIVMIVDDTRQGRRSEGDDDDA